MLWQPTSKYQYQTSEKCWAKTKSFAGKCYFHGRSQHDLIEQIKIGFYGGTYGGPGTKHPEIAQTTSKKIDAHCVQGYLKECMNHNVPHESMIRFEHW